MATQVKRYNYGSTNVRVGLKRAMTLVALSTASFLAPGLIRRYLRDTFFVARRTPISGTQHDILDMAEAFDISIHNKKVKCWRWGSGPVVLLAHGWNGRGIQLGRYIEPLVNQGYTAVAFDAPGHGDSEGEDSNYFLFTDTIRHFLKMSSMAPVHGVIAHSIGGAAAINALHKEKSDLKLVLLAPSLHLVKLLLKAFSAYGIPLFIVKRLLHNLEKQYGYSLEKDNPYDLLSEIRSKTLIIHDRGDRTTPYGESEKISEELNHVELHSTKGLGHKRLLTNGDIIERVLDEFSVQ